MQICKEIIYKLTINFYFSFDFFRVFRLNGSIHQYFNRFSISHFQLERIKVDKNKILHDIENFHFDSMWMGYFQNQSLIQQNFKFGDKKCRHDHRAYHTTVYSTLLYLAHYCFQHITVFAQYCHNCVQSITVSSKLLCLHLPKCSFFQLYNVNVLWSYHADLAMHLTRTMSKKQNIKIESRSYFKTMFKKTFKFKFLTNTELIQ